MSTNSTPSLELVIDIPLGFAALSSAQLFYFIFFPLKSALFIEIQVNYPTNRCEEVFIVLT